MGFAVGDDIAGGELKFRCVDKYYVVPANAGTHTPCPIGWTTVGETFRYN